MFRFIFVESSESWNRGRFLRDREVVREEDSEIRSGVPPRCPLQLLSSSVTLTSLSNSSFVPDHPGASIAIVEIVTKSNHPAGNGIIGADPS